MRRVRLWLGVVVLSMGGMMVWGATEPAREQERRSPALVRPARRGAQGPLRVHPRNPRYFSDGTNRVIFLTGSHTWAVGQERGVAGETPDFDYAGWLDFMVGHGHNFMRYWAWEHGYGMQFAGREVPIRYKPLPYARTGPGRALDGKPKFDLTKWNETYFQRLRGRVKAAGERGIYVAVMLFQGFSVEQKGTKGVDPKKGNPWEGHPFNGKNNINGIEGDLNGDGEGNETHTPANPAVARLQEAYVRKVIDTVSDLDNVMYEISNESFGGSTAWQYHIIKTIRTYEKTKRFQHLIGMTFQWGKDDKKGSNRNLFESPADWISPEGEAYLDDPPTGDGKKIVVVDTDHISPWGGNPEWVWKNLMRGNHFILMDNYLDYRSGARTTKSGRRRPDPKYEAIRRAMGYARRLTELVDVAALTPRGDLATTGYCLADPEKVYLVYQPNRGERVGVSMAGGEYSMKIYNCQTGELAQRGRIKLNERVKWSFNPPIKAPTVVYLRRRER